ncbi:glutathione S-transferase family protein [Aquabacterium sp.]|uniref:glutathione S-transferase family protein n=1 Tax=Aquabacterium sp. TaxID=1872578 RepID=UPI003D6CD991
MSLSLYAHPFSSYCQKVLTALYENATPHTFRMLDGSGTAGEEFATLWPIKRMPLLIDGERTVAEASIIIEHLGLHHAGPVRLIPQDADAALDVRFMDRFFDNYVMTPMQRIVADFIRPPEQRDARTVSEAKALLDDAYQWLDQRMADREWACATGFSLADCAAAPSLFYADWVHPMDEQRPHAQAYRRRLLARPSFARAVDEARPFRHFFPPGAPDRD